MQQVERQRGGPDGDGRTSLRKPTHPWRCFCSLVIKSRFCGNGTVNGSANDSCTPRCHLGLLLSFVLALLCRLLPRQSPDPRWAHALQGRSARSDCRTLRSPTWAREGCKAAHHGLTQVNEVTWSVACPSMLQPTYGGALRN